MPDGRMRLLAALSKGFNHWKATRTERMKQTTPKSGKASSAESIRRESDSPESEKGRLLKNLFFKIGEYLSMLKHPSDLTGGTHSRLFNANIGQKYLTVVCKYGNLGLVGVLSSPRDSLEGAGALSALA